MEPVEIDAEKSRQRTLKFTDEYLETSQGWTSHHLTRTFFVVMRLCVYAAPRETQSFVDFEIGCLRQNRYTPRSFVGKGQTFVEL